MAESSKAASTSESSPAESTQQHPVPTVEQVATAAERPVVDQWAVAAASPELLPTTQAPAGDEPVDEAVARERWEPRPAIGEVPAKTSGATPPLTQAVGLREPYSPPPPKDRKPLIIGAAIVLLLVGAPSLCPLGVTVAISPQTPGTTGLGAATRAHTIPVEAVTTSRPTGSTVATTVASTLAGSTFSDSTNVYRLRVAPTWQDVTTGGGLQTWVTGTGSAAFKDQVNVLIEKLPVDISMEDYLAASVKTRRSRCRHRRVRRSGTRERRFRSTRLPFKNAFRFSSAVVRIKGRMRSSSPQRTEASIRPESTKVSRSDSVEGV